MNASLQDRYVRLAILLGATWMAVLTATILIDHGHGRAHASQTQTDVPDRALESLRTRVGTVESQLAAQRRSAAPISAERFADVTRVLDERLTRLEQGATHVVSAQQLEALATRVSVLEVARTRSVHVSTILASQSKSPTASNTPAAPPFRVLGLEMRGGERFLAVAPPNAVSLSEISVLRVGDVEDGWQLEAIDTQSATFRFQGQQHRLELP